MERETVERVWFIHVCESVCRDFFIWRKLKLSALTLVIASECDVI